MAARTPYNASGEDDNGGGDPQQILRSCAESLLTAVARLEGGERSLTAPAQTPVARSSSPTTSSTAIEEHRRSTVVIKMWQAIWHSAWSGSQQKNYGNNKEWRVQSLSSKEHLDKIVCLSLPKKRPRGTKYEW